ncbi:MAG TPA: hypothetical protein VKG84_02535 [Candidatus Acidoferrales bacterium]|nr:hypothetical protein [Candidatus Acidoferrales bacterium]
MRRLRTSFHPHSVLFLAPLLAFAAALSAPPALAQSQAETATAAVPRVYDVSREVVLRGTISQVVSQPAAGLPRGFHVLLSTAQGTVDVHLGPYLGRSPAAKRLITGAAIQVTGVTTHFEAGDVLLARIVLVGDQTITVRNENGMPLSLRPVPPGARANRSLQPAGGL